MTLPSPLDEPTLRLSLRESDAQQPGRRLMLTLALHPSLRRVGEQAPVVVGAGGFLLSRRTPEFRAPGGPVVGPLADRYISRAPLVLHVAGDGGLVVERGAGEADVVIDGVRLARRHRIEASAIARGAVIELARRVVLLLHAHGEPDERPPTHELVGESAAIQRVRREIGFVAGLDIPVLVRGESGTGKELVARAIHAASPRAGRPYVSLNMGAFNASTAIAELFGHRRGAFTGALQSREGFFREADGGTLFLDEVGEASAEIQAMLLRVLESGEIQPLGGGQAQRVDARIIAATDADLERSIELGSFRAALLHRLAGYELRVPPLRERPDDIPRLLVHFLELELRRARRPECFEQLATDASKQIGAPRVAALLREAWRGNVRQLRNYTRRLVVALLGLGDDPGIPASAWPEQPEGPAPPRKAARTSQVSDRGLHAALEANDWQIAATARALGVSRNTLYARMKRSGHLVRARDLPRDTLVELYRRHDGDLAAIARDLRVSVRGLHLRLRELGIGT